MTLTRADYAAELERRETARRLRDEAEARTGAEASVAGFSRWRHRERYKPHRFSVELSAALDAFSDEIEAGGFPRWCLSAPPGHGKTDHVGRSMPARLILRAARRGEPFPVFYVTSSDDRALEVSLNVRRTVELLAETSGLRALQPSSRWSATDWRTLGGHHWVAVGALSSTGGIDARLLVIDDATGSAERYNSAADRARLVRALEEDWLSRIRGSGGALLMETRRGVDDLIGYVQREYPGVWRDKVWRLIAEPGDNDWRQPGDYLWPEVYGPDWHAANPHVRGRLLATLYQQKPTPDDGTLFRREWLSTRYSEAPQAMALRCEVTVLSLDPAATEGAGDHSVIQWWGFIGARAYLLGQWRGQWGYPTLRATALDCYQRCRPSAFLVEDTSNGRALRQELKGAIPGLIEVDAKGAKRDRIAAETPAMEAGQVYLPEPSHAPWVPDLVERLVSLTGFGSEVDDEADAMAIALRWRRTRAAKVVDVGGYLRALRGIS